MSPGSLSRAALFAAVLVIIAVFSWESYIRSTGFELSFDDGGPLWSHHRDKVYQPIDLTTVFIGSSRIKFDLDIATWEKKTGTHAVQLACVGSTPRPLLTDLANDPKFRGKVIVDVTEGLFFSMAPNNASRPNEVIKYHDHITPTQRVGFMLNTPLESTFAFLDKDHYSINAMLDNLEIPSRKGVFMPPVFARDFGYSKFSRQDYMGRLFIADTAQQHQQQNIWAMFGRMNRFPPISGPPLDSILHLVKMDVDKIKSKGGDVFFVRTPSSGPFLEKEEAGFPKDKYWDRILAETGCKGMHFKDHPPIDHYQCPEFSHLSPEDAVDFTSNFIDIMENNYGWIFPTTYK
ncbi:MAG TPA: hypothetical protein VFG10_11860 [Saprospiraceae bacterium]|nr:hypothetical protein [Saprospiraceae bacterium]